MLDDLCWLLRKRRGPGQERYYLQQLTRVPMKMMELSIDPRGEWSITKAKRVLEIINPEAERHKLFFQPVDITTFNMPAHRVILVAYCLEHEIAVAYGELCSECMRHAKR